MIVDPRPPQWDWRVREHARQLAAWAYSFRELNDLPHPPGTVLPLQREAQAAAQ